MPWILLLLFGVRNYRTRSACFGDLILYSWYPSSKNILAKPLASANNLCTTNRCLMVDELPRINTPEQINYYLQSWAQTDLNAEIIPVLVCYKCFADFFMNKICTSVLFIITQATRCCAINQGSTKIFSWIRSSHTPSRFSSSFHFFLIWASLPSGKS